MRVLITGALGKVGRAAVRAFQAAGHDVTATDLADPAFDAPPEGTAAYVKADLTDAGQVYALVGGAAQGEGAKAGRYDAVVHGGAIPAPTPRSGRSKRPCRNTRRWPRPPRWRS